MPAPPGSPSACAGSPSPTWSSSPPGSRWPRCCCASTDAWWRGRRRPRRPDERRSSVIARPRRAALSALLLATLPVGVHAQAKDAVPGATVTVAAGAHYRAGGVHRFFLGDDYRDLWTMPIRVEVLDLRAYAGGLKPAFRVGGQETKGLAMKGADGRDYTFRGIDKDPSGVLPADLQGTIAERIVQDQISSEIGRA